MTSYKFLKAIYKGIRHYHGLCRCGKRLVRAGFAAKWPEYETPALLPVQYFNNF